LRTLALTRKLHGNDAMDRVYVALGERVHERKEEMDPDTVRAALGDAGLEASLVEEALADPSTIEDVKADHDAAVEDVGAFGVPTIVLTSGKGIFGPVVSKPPEGAASGELWDRVEWLIEQDGFYELKRARDKKPGE
jgi:predicted DsbA family dithiol-disulfide isomerase